MEMVPNPAMQKYRMLQQMQQNQQAQQNPESGQGTPQMPGGPLSAGSMQGIEAARNSIGAASQAIRPTDIQNNRALGMALMHFANRPVPEAGSGFAGNLGSVNAAFLPAAQAYQQEQNNAENINAQLLQYQQRLQHQRVQEEARKETQRARLEAAERPYRQMTAYQQAMLNRAPKESKEEHQYANAEKRRASLQAQGVLPEGAVLFDEIPDKDLRKAKIKEVETAKNMYPAAVENIRSLDEMQKIINRNPRLWKQYSTILSAEVDADNNPGLFKKLVSNISEKDKSDFQLLEKYKSDLTINTIKTLPGRPTDLVKKEVIKSLAGSGTTPKAFAGIRKKMTRVNQHTARQAKQARSAWEHGYSVPFDNSSLDEYVTQREAPGYEESMNAPQSAQNPNAAIDAEIEQLKAQYQQLANSPDE
jgi:hypothetical protein